MHDYFYHNLGQTLTLTAADGSDLNLQPTESALIYPAFAGMAELRDASGECWQKVVSEGASVDDAVADAAAKAAETCKSYSK